MNALRLSLPLADIVDWPLQETDGYDLSVQINTVVNLFHFRTLDLMAQVAEALSHSADATYFRQRAELVRASIVHNLFDTNRGLFIDGEGSRHASLHANMFALAFDVVPAEFAQSVLAFVKAKDMACSVYGAQYLLEGLYRHGEDAHAVALLTARGQRSWAHMIYDLGATITHEAWDPAVKSNEDWNHAWGAAPANIIPRWLMGVRPLSPGFATFAVSPQLGTLAWAEVRIPTVRGAIEVRAQRDSMRGTIRVSVPANAEAFVRPLCTNRGAPLWLDGQPYGLSASADTDFVGPLAPGAHTVECVGP
jgi:hypothetical protein